MSNSKLATLGVDVAVLELGELLQAVATKPIAAAATKILCVISPT